MSAPLSEVQVLKKLNITDFGELSKSKDTVLSFASMLSEMQPEVAQKALEQFPDFSKTIVELATEYKALIDKGLDSNSASMKSCSEMLQAIIDVCQAQVGKDDIPFDEKKYYLDKMFEASKLQMQQDEKNKDFLKKVFGIAGLAIVTVGGAVLSAALGLKINLPIKK